MPIGRQLDDLERRLDETGVLMSDLPADYKAFIAEASAVASRHGLTLAWDDSRGALLVRRNPNVPTVEHEHVGGDPQRCDACEHTEGHPIHGVV